MISKVRSRLGKTAAVAGEVTQAAADDSSSPIFKKVGSPLSVDFEPSSSKSDPKPFGGGGRVLFRSFLILVALPALITLLYSFLWASDVYVVESKMTVREALDPSSGRDGLSSSSASSLLSSLGISGSTGTAQDTLVLLDYLKSRAVIQAIGGRDAMNGYYNRPSIDYFSRLGDTQDMETMWAYWRGHVTASVDTLSNILTIKVAAYSADDALALSHSILTSNEALINRISERNRHDALSRAELEVETSMNRLADVRAQLLDFQKRNNTLDPVESAKQVTELISSLTIKKLEIESVLASSRLSQTSNTPGYRYNQNQLSVITTQIETLKSSLTGGQDGNNISQQLREFEILKLRYSFAEQVYTLARASFEDARRKFTRQQLYAVIVVPPLLPDEATYPRPLINSVLVFCGAFIFWAIMALVAVGIKDSSS